MKQSIISIGMTACCLSGNGQSLFAANKPAQEERPNILFILSYLRGRVGGICPQREYPSLGCGGLRIG